MKRYGNFTAVDDLSISIEAGEVYGLLGPNGAGKTTTTRVLMGFIEADAGSVELFGQSVTRSQAALREQVGYLPGELRVDPSPTGKKLIDFHAGFRPNLDRTYQAELIERLQLDPSKKVRSYSKGNRQKLGLILALQHQPKLLILDEPTSGLDPLMQREFYRLVSEQASQGAAVLFSSHMLNEVESVCQRVGVMRNGQLVFEKTVTELMAERLRRIDVQFEGEPPSDATLETCPGVRRIEHRGARREILYDGPPNPILALLNQFPLVDLIFERPDLEDIFMTFYDEEDEASPDATQPAKPEVSA